MVETVKQVDSTAFDELLESTSKLVIVEFYTTSCPNCAAIEPVYRSLSNELRSVAVFTQVNAEQHPALASRFGVMGVPTFKFFCKKRPIGELVGAINTTLLRNTIKDIVRHRNECYSRSTPISYEMDGYG